MVWIEVSHEAGDPASLDRQVAVAFEEECADSEVELVVELEQVPVEAIDPTLRTRLRSQRHRMLLVRPPMLRVAETDARRLFVQCSWLVGLVCALLARMYAMAQVCDWAVAVGIRSNRCRGGSSHASLSPDSRQDPGCNRKGSPGGSRSLRNSRDNPQYSDRNGQGHVLEHDVGDSWPPLVE